MSKSAADINRTLETTAPALYQALAPLGRRAFYPPDIPVQAAEARQTKFNGTIGVLTDGLGGALPLPSIDRALHLSAVDRDRALLYSPVPGIPELRNEWRLWQRRDQPDEVPSSLPLVTNGLTHGLSIAADLFGGERRAVAIAQPFWGNYRQTFAMRTGAEIRAAAGFRERRFQPEVFAEALEGLPAGEPAVVLVNFPANPCGYSPTVAEREALERSLLAIADERPLVVLCDDAYSGLVYDPEVPKTSLFWDRATAHENLVAIKIDGATKEFAFFGGRVGFFTLALDPDSQAAKAMENKFCSLMRSTIGSPVATSQVVLLQALRSGEAMSEIDEIHRLAAQRYQALQPSLASLDLDLLRPLPFNAGYFALIEIPEELGIDPDALRRHLIEYHDTGVIAVAPRYVRLAICSVAAEALPEMVERLVQATRELAGRA